MPKRNLSNWKMIKISFSSFLEQKKDVSFALNRVPPPHLPTSPFMGTPLPPPQGRRLLCTANTSTVKFTVNTSV